MLPPGDRYSAIFPAYSSSDPTFEAIGAHRPWIRRDLSEPDALRWYDHGGTMRKKSDGLTATAIFEADALTRLTHPQVMARGVFAGPF